MEQLFDEQGDRKEMVLDYKNMDEAYSDLFYRIKENLLLVMTMTLETFQRYYPQFSNVFNKSGIVRMSRWEIWYCSFFVYTFLNFPRFFSTESGPSKVRKIQNSVNKKCTIS